MPAGRDQLTPMRRLVRIMAVLDQAGSVGASRDQLVAVAGYGDADPGSQLALDLKHLRAQGWQIDNVAGIGEAARYRMVPGDNRLRLRLTPAQSAALQRAVIMTDRTDLAERLGVGEASLPTGVGTQVVPRDAGRELTDVLRAVQLGSRVAFTYKGVRRLIDPGTVTFRDHHWYLSGVEVDAEGQGGLVKHFVVDRMSETTLAPPGSAHGVPQVQRLPLHPLQWEIDEPVVVRVRAATDYVPDVERWLSAPDARQEGDGWVGLDYTVTHRSAFRARLYVLGTRVRVVGPEEFREELLAELRTMAGA